MKLYNEVKHKVEVESSEHIKFIKAMSRTITGATTL